VWHQLFIAHLTARIMLDCHQAAPTFGCSTSIKIFKTMFESNTHKFNPPGPLLTCVLSRPEQLAASAPLHLMWPPCVHLPLLLLLLLPIPPPPLLNLGTSEAVVEAGSPPCHPCPQLLLLHLRLLAQGQVLLVGQRSPVAGQQVA
jgi:hypothetical protein